MACKSTIWLIAVLTMAYGSANEDLSANGPRTLHRLIGGYRHNVQSELSDAGLLTASAGEGRETRQQKLDEDEEKKTLAQQVADGKYGLIQKELFSKTVKRPGIISYESNSEVPKDNAHNLGGLNKNEIWLAENHLLVLKGGTYTPHEARPETSAPIWPPIDDFNAPRRQVKIPEHPKVPPPFPVQLTEGGPLQILGTNSSRTINGSFDSALYAVPPPEGYIPGNGPFFPPPYPYAPNATAGENPFPIPPYPPPDSGEYRPGNGAPPPFPFPINGTLSPFFDTLPPGAIILPPPGNLTDYDEDDPSIYYPPPYSFFYPKDNSSVVAPGPLVPGIVLPPPPDFFAPLAPAKPVKVTPTRILTSTDGPTQIHPTTTSLPPTPVLENVFKKKPIHALPDIHNELKPVTPKPHVVTIQPVYYDRSKNTTPVVLPIRTQKPYLPVQRRPTHRKKTPNVTILKPVEPSSTPKYNQNNNIVTGTKPFEKYGPPNQIKTIISTTKIPLKSYFTASNDIDKNTVTQTPNRQYYTTPKPTLRPTKVPGKPSTEYYFFEEDPSSNAITTPSVPIKTFRQNQYFNVPKQYQVPTKDTVNYQGNGKKEDPRYTNIQQPQYYYVTSRPYTTLRPQYRFVEQKSRPDSYKAHIAKLQQQIQLYYNTQKPYQEAYEYDVNQPETPSPKPVYQYSFQAANYQEQHNKFNSAQNQGQGPQDKFRPLPRYSVQIQPAIEITTKPPPTTYENNRGPMYYPVKQQVNTERPISSQYYTARPTDYEYDDVDVNNRHNTAGAYVIVTPNSAGQGNEYGATPNPVYQTFYTQQDQRLFDDRTKKYFTMFGQKLPSVTTPLPPIPQRQNPNINTRPVYYQPPPNIQQNYEQITKKPISLEGDILVNYIHPRPTQNPDAEFVPIRGQAIPKYPQVTKYVPQVPQQYINQPQKGPSLQGDININYKQPQPPVNVNAEIVRAVNVPVPVSNKVGEGQPGSFISYELPGDDGAHFYFLTPQLAQKRDQGVVYYYSKPNAPRRSKRDTHKRQL